MRYPYDLNIDVDEIRKDINFLIGMYNEFDKDYLDSHGCQTYDESVFYPSFSLVADLKLEAIQDFYKLFNNSFISVFKIFQMQPNEIYGYHIDNNKHKIYSNVLHNSVDHIVKSTMFSDVPVLSHPFHSSKWEIEVNEWAKKSIWIGLFQLKYPTIDITNFYELKKNKPLSN